MQLLFRLLIFLIQPYMFWATNSPSSGALFDRTYSFWYSAPTLLPTGATVEMELHEVPFKPWHRLAAEAVRFTKSCIYSQKVLLRMGEFVARNMLGWFKNTDKRKSCCILLVVHIVVLVMIGHTNIKFTRSHLHFLIIFKWGIPVAFPIFNRSI